MSEQKLTVTVSVTVTKEGSHDELVDPQVRVFTATVTLPENEGDDYACNWNKDMYGPLILEAVDDAVDLAATAL